MFSEREQIFPGPMTTAAAIDRLIHLAVIFELGGPGSSRGFNSVPR
jgi:hypothetical protein